MHQGDQATSNRRWSAHSSNIWMLCLTEALVVALTCMAFACAERCVHTTGNLQGADLVSVGELARLAFASLCLCLLLYVRLETPQPPAHLPVNKRQQYFY
jgi:hypothetical protein